MDARPNRFPVIRFGPGGTFQVSLSSIWLPLVLIQGEKEIIILMELF